MTVERAPAQQASGVTQRASRSRLDLYPYWLVAPSLVAIGAIILYPIAQAILLSFQEGNLLKGGMVEPRPFVGLRNYATALGLPEFWRSLWVTVLYSLLSVAASYGIGLFMALLLTSAFRGRAVARVLAIAPWAMPPVVTSIVWLWMYDPQFGVINYLLQRAGLIATNLAWLADPLLALPAVIAVTVWKHVPLAMMVLLAGLQSIPQELYEAARIDGARPVDEFRHVTLPGLRPVSAVIVLMLSLWTFKEFTYVYVLTGGGPGRATETLVLQVYDQAFKYLDFGLAAATGVLVMLLCFAFAAIYLPVVYGGIAMALASDRRVAVAPARWGVTRVSRRTAFYLLVVVTILANLFPFYWMVVTSLKSWAGIFTYPPTFLPLPLDTTAYREVFEKSRLGLWLVNSVAIGLPTTVLALICSTSGAYALSRFRFRGRGLTGMLILVTQMLPGTLLVIPIYLMFKAWGLLDTHLALILAYATFALPFCIWMLKGYFDTIPIELEEAALVDGCTRLQVLWRIVLPLSLPGLTVTAMFAFVLAWNDLVLAITLNSNPELRTVAVGLASFVGEYGTPWGQIMAASAVSSLPILLLFLFLQRYLLYGLTAGAVKG